MHAVAMQLRTVQHLRIEIVNNSKRSMKFISNSLIQRTKGQLHAASHRLALRSKDRLLLKF